MALCVKPVFSIIRFSFGTLTFELRRKFTLQYGYMDKILFYIVYQDLSHLDGDRPNLFSRGTVSMIDTDSILMY